MSSSSEPAPTSKTVVKDEFAAVSSIPGAGWSNGNNLLLPESSSMYPFSRAGRLAMYQQRRWIPLTTGWTRIGEGTTEFDARHSSSQSGQKIAADDDEDPGVAVKALMAQLCQNFYQQGWATGTGGGVSIRIPITTSTTAAEAAATSVSEATNTATSWRVFVAPSGIQKEDMIADDIFEMDMDMNIVAAPKTPNLRPSACTPLWFCVYKHRPTAQCVIHTHSMYAQLATLLDPTEQSKTLRITHLEMLKGVGNHAYDDVLEIPIIDNRPTEDALADQLSLALQKFPKTNAVLVRRHGLYAWGDSWEQAKTQCESFDYLFHAAVMMKTQLSMDPGRKPQHGTYREDVATTGATPPAAAVATGATPPAAAASAQVRVKMEEGLEEGEVESSGDEARPLKKSKTIPKEENDVPMAMDVASTNTLVHQPSILLPRDGKALILDIRGCTTPAKFFEEVLDPFITNKTQWALENDEMRDPRDEGEILNILDEDLEEVGLKEAYDQDFKKDYPNNADVPECAAHQLKWMAAKNLQTGNFMGMLSAVWRIGLEQGKLRGKVFPDMLPMLQWMKQNNVPVYTFSSDMTEYCQEPYFENSTQGDLSNLIRSHYDIPNLGSTKDVSSFKKLVEKLNRKASDLVFVSAGEAALTAAQQAGLQVVLSVRDGNPPVTDDAIRRLPAIESLLQLCG